MVLADRQKQFLLHLESYLVYEKEHEIGHSHHLCFGRLFTYALAGCFMMSVH